MNCKPGDLAVVVRSDAGNEGKIVRCLRIVDGWLEGLDGSGLGEPVWEVDRVLRACDGSEDNLINDSYLRPIRDPGDDAVDETLQRLPAPIIQPKIKEDKSEVAHG